MLLQFTVSNFKSFDEPTTFSMRAGGDKDHAGHLIGPEKFRAVRGGAIYGANNAGKSNLVLAMGFARDLIVERDGAGLGALAPSRCSVDKERASGFHWQFLHAGKVWSYGFEVSKTQIVEEYLFAREEKGGKEKRWFERKTDQNGVTKVQFGAGFEDAMTKEDAQLLKLKAPRVDKNRLFLRAARAEKVKAVNAVFEWFEEVLVIVRAETAYGPLLPETTQNKKLLQFISDHLTGAGTGIQKLSLLSRNLEDADFDEGPVELQKYLQDMKEQVKGGNFVTVHHPEKNVRMQFRLDEAGKMKADTLNAIYQMGNGDYEVFDLWEESEGTQRLIHLLPHFYRLQTRPTVLVIDEIERRLHTLLTRRLVETALDGSPFGYNQFIFTTHDTNLLDSALLRRDEIWFVDKDERGASSLVSLVEFKIRADANYEKGYLLGAFDGIPYFRAVEAPVLAEGK